MVSGDKSIRWGTKLGAIPLYFMTTGSQFTGTWSFHLRLRLNIDAPVLILLHSVQVDCNVCVTYVVSSLTSEDSAPQT